MAATEKSRITKAAAISFLAKTGNPSYLKLYQENINDSSYSVAGAALEGLNILQPEQAYALSKKYSSDAKGDLGTAVFAQLVKEGNENDVINLTKIYSSLQLFEKIQQARNFANYLGKIQDIATVKKGIDVILKYRNEVPAQYRVYTDPGFKAALNELGRVKGQEISDYIIKGFK